MQLGNVANRFDTHGQLKRSVLAGVVKDHDFFDVLPDGGRNPFEDGHERRDRIIGDDKNADALALGRGKRRICEGGKLRPGHE